MHPEPARYPSDAADAELVFPSKLLEQLHRRFPPTHRTPCRPWLVGRVGRARTTGGPFPSINLGRSTISKLIAHLWVDQGYTGTGKSWIEEHLGWRVEVVRHPPQPRGEWI